MKHLTIVAGAVTPPTSWQLRARSCPGMAFASRVVWFGTFVLCVVWFSSQAAADATSGVGAQQTASHQQLIELNRQLQIATQNYDVATLSRLVTDDYELISTSGKVYDRAAFLADAADRSIQYEQNDPQSVSVRLYNNDCAIVTAVLHVRYRFHDKVTDSRLRYTDVWIKKNDRWRYASGQASLLKHAHV